MVGQAGQAGDRYWARCVVVDPTKRLGEIPPRSPAGGPMGDAGLRLRRWSRIRSATFCLRSRKPSGETILSADSEIEVPRDV